MFRFNKIYILFHICLKGHICKNKKIPTGATSTPRQDFIYSQALPTEPNSSIFSFTVSLIASNPGARTLRGSYPLP